MTLKRITVVMLPTNEKTNLFIDKGQLLYFPDHKRSYVEWKDVQYQHLYFLSDEEIKEGDWYIWWTIGTSVQFGTVIQAKNGMLAKAARAKIIATTDSSLQDFNFDPEKKLGNYLPQPSQSFLEVFVKEYNKGNVIKEVMVEYEEVREIRITNDHDGQYDNDCLVGYSPKINLKDNAITIKRVKDS
jgi:hypothetical protein